MITVYVVECYDIINMYDAVLEGYTIFADKELAQYYYPSAVDGNDHKEESRVLERGGYILRTVHAEGSK